MARSSRLLSMSLVLALLVSLVVWLKARAHARVCARYGARPVAFIRLPEWLRAGLAGLAAGGALFVGAELEEPGPAGALLLVSLILSTHRVPKSSVRARGPGRWLALSESEAFASKRELLPGGYLDAGSLRGFVLFALGVALVLVFAYLELPRSPYRALLFVLSGSILLPVFFTGCASDLHGDRVAFSRAFLRRFGRRLKRRPALRVVPWARVPDGSAEPDELRVLVKPRDAVDGLVALEVLLEPQRGMGGLSAAPYVLVRAREGSVAERALAGGAWTRGRKPTERVLLLSPPLPTLGLTITLVERLVETLKGQPPRSARKSSGRVASTRKLGTVPSPAHAT
jgi:hypothetical protein